MNKRHIAVARLWFEGNSFCPRRTTLKDFQTREWHDAASMVAGYENTRTEMGAVVDWMHAHAADYQTHVLRCAAAPPGGPLDTGVYDTIVNDIVHGLQQLQVRHPLDGVYLSLHGAMVAQDHDNADCALVKRIRECIGWKIPLALSFDLHANHDPYLSDLADIMVGYKTYPHVDMYETAERALDLLHRSLLGEIRPLSHVAITGVVLPSHAMATTAVPMHALETMADSMVKRRQALDVTPFGGFGYADTAQTSSSMTVCVDALQHPGFNAARQYAAMLAQKMVDALLARRTDFIPTLPNSSEGLRQAYDYLDRHQGCVAVVDPADNPLSGGTGDTTGLLAALMAQPIRQDTVFAFFHDPALVGQCHALGVGAHLPVQLGGRVVPEYGGSIAFDAVVERLTSGDFINDGPMEQGLSCHIGRTVVLRGAQLPLLRVVVTETCQSPNDMAWCRLHGIDLQQVRLLCIKAKNHFRAAFAQHLACIIDVDAPGPAMLDFSRLPYRFLPRNRLS
ncbi:M81 family metallopeptidase [Verminephrobacter eiseniae]|uniref:M81 family metallopeptidase n=1 Tax=Verminephrobacter eiseniae TaxID=364317 RepID=UPI00223778AF|nr:M81 family metallopeptidase [Verminephrobacter eiseniae]MCW5236453.1 M81 family peptidase [Verminephrobacter eiseniae]